MIMQFIKKSKYLSSIPNWSCKFFCCYGLGMCERWNKAYWIGLRRRTNYLRSRCNVILRLIQPLICVEIFTTLQERAPHKPMPMWNAHKRCTCIETSSMENRIYSKHRCYTDVRCNSNNRKKIHKFEQTMLLFLSSLFSAMRKIKKGETKRKRKEIEYYAIYRRNKYTFFFFFYWRASL